MTPAETVAAAVEGLIETVLRRSDSGPFTERWIAESRAELAAALDAFCIARAALDGGRQ